MHYIQSFLLRPLALLSDSLFFFPQFDVVTWHRHLMNWACSSLLKYPLSRCCNMPFILCHICLLLHLSSVVGFIIVDHGHTVFFFLSVPCRHLILGRALISVFLVFLDRAQIRKVKFEIKKQKVLQSLCSCVVGIITTKYFLPLPCREAFIISMRVLTAYHFHRGLMP